LKLLDPPLRLSRRGGVYRALLRRRKEKEKKNEKAEEKTKMEERNGGSDADSDEEEEEEEEEVAVVVKASTKPSDLRGEYERLLMCSSDCDCGHSRETNNHNIARAVALHEDPASLYAAMVTEDAGISLAEWASRKRRRKRRRGSGGTGICLAEVLKIGVEVCEALDHLHRNARIIHGDVNPTNVCVKCLSSDGGGGNEGGEGGDENEKDDYDCSCEGGCELQVTLIDLGAAHGFLEPFKSL